MRFAQGTDGGGARLQLRRHPADLDVDRILIGGGDHPLRSVAGRGAQRQRAGAVAKQGLERLIGRLRAEAFELRRVGVEHHHPPLVGELTGEFASGLAGSDDDDSGQSVTVRCRMSVFRGRRRSAVKHGDDEGAVKRA